MSSLYLAGPITGLSYDGATSWRGYVAEQLAAVSDIKVVSPLRGSDYLRDEKKIALKYDAHAMSTAQAITTRDRFDVQRCDLMLAYFAPDDEQPLNVLKVSVGTIVEFGWADAFRTPVILCAHEDHPLRKHPMTSSIAGWVVDDLDHAIAIAKCTLHTGREQ